jgi:hypothetical protein
MFIYNLENKYKLFFFYLKENIHLQLEAALRQRMAAVYGEVKKRLVRFLS